MSNRTYTYALPVASGLAWWLATAPGLVSPLFVASPQAVLAAAATALTNEQLYSDVGFTAYRVLTGFAIAALIGTTAGMLMGYSRSVYALLAPGVDFFRGIPVTALIPLFLLAFGLGDDGRIAMIAWSAGLTITVNTMYGVHQGSVLRLKVARSLKASEAQVFLRVILPEALPQIVSGYRIAISMSLVIAVATEMFIGTSHGLGRSILDAQLAYKIPEMYVAIIVTGLLGYGLNQLLITIEKRVSHKAS